MDEQEALRIGCRAVEEAHEKHGDDREQIIQALTKAMEADPELMVAFALVGHLMLTGEQSQKH